MAVPFEQSRFDVEPISSDFGFSQQTFHTLFDCALPPVYKCWAAYGRVADDAAHAPKLAAVDPEQPVTYVRYRVTQILAFGQRSALRSRSAIVRSTTSAQSEREGVFQARFHYRSMRKPGTAASKPWGAFVVQTREFSTNAHTSAYSMMGCTP